MIRYGDCSIASISCPLSTANTDVDLAVVAARPFAELSLLLPVAQLDRQGYLYKVAIRDRAGVSLPLTAVVQMIRMLWEGHTDRHEGVTPALPITNEAAQMAVPLAVTLVQWFASGTVVRR